MNDIDAEDLDRIKVFGAYLQGRLHSLSDGEGYIYPDSGATYLIIDITSKVQGLTSEQIDSLGKDLVDLVNNF